MRRIFAGVVLLVILTGRAAAFDPSYTTLDCAFEHQNTIDIRKDQHTKDDAAQKPMTMTFTGMNEKEMSATLVGNLGSSPLMFFSNPMRWVFVEVTPAGNVMVTSMMVPAASGETYAVHSRHAWLLDSGLISQWAGTCRAR
jgi:hypothetical protein